MAGELAARLDTIVTDVRILTAAADTHDENRLTELDTIRKPRRGRPWTNNALVDWPSIELPSARR